MFLKISEFFLILICAALFVFHGRENLGLITPVWAAFGQRPEIVVQLGHHKHVSSPALSRDEKYLVSGSKDGVVILWDVESARQICQFFGNGKSVTSVDISGHNSFLATGGEQGLLRIWDVKAREQIHGIQGHGDRISTVDFSFDESLLLSVSKKEASLKIWKTGTGKLAGQVQGIVTAVFHPKNYFVFAAFQDNSVRIYNLSTGKTVREITGIEGSIKQIGYSSNYDNLFVLSSTSNATVVNIYTGNGESLSQFRTKEKIVQAALCSFGFMAMNEYGGTKLWNLDTWDKWIGQKSDPWKIDIAAFSSNGLSIVYPVNPTLLFTPQIGMAGISWKKRRKRGYGIQVQEEKMFRGRAYMIQAFAISSFNKRYIFTGGADETVKQWDFSTGREMRRFKAEVGWLPFQITLPDIKPYVLFRSENRAKLINFETGEIIQQFQASPRFQTISTDGSRVLMYDKDKSLRLWDTESGNSLCTFSAEQEHKKLAEPFFGRFSTSGRYAIIGELIRSPGSSSFLYSIVYPKLMNCKTCQEVLKSFSGI